MKERLKQIKQLFQFAHHIGIKPHIFIHEKVGSCEGSKRIYDTLSFRDADYGLCKNIFISDKSGKIDLVLCKVIITEDLMFKPYAAFCPNYNYSGITSFIKIRELLNS